MWGCFCLHEDQLLFLKCFAIPPPPPPTSRPSRISPLVMGLLQMPGRLTRSKEGSVDCQALAESCALNVDADAAAPLLFPSPDGVILARNNWIIIMRRSGLSSQESVLAQLENINRVMQREFFLSMKSRQFAWVLYDCCYVWTTLGLVVKIDAKSNTSTKINVNRSHCRRNFSAEFTPKGDFFGANWFRMIESFYFI